MYIVSIESKVPLPEWFRLRLFSEYDKAEKWFEACGGMTMGKCEDTSMCSNYSCGELTLKIKKVILDEACPEIWKEYLNKIMGESNNLKKEDMSCELPRVDEVLRSYTVEDL